MAAIIGVAVPAATVVTLLPIYIEFPVPEVILIAVARLPIFLNKIVIPTIEAPTMTGNVIVNVVALFTRYNMNFYLSIDIYIFIIKYTMKINFILPAYEFLTIVIFLIQFEVSLFLVKIVSTIINTMRGNNVIDV